MQITILWILIAVIFVLFLKESKNKILRKMIGSILIGIGIFIISPVPGFDDALMYPIFASFMNWEVSLIGFKQNFLPYAISTIIIGLGISWLGIFIAGYKISYLTNKIKKIWR